MHELEQSLIEAEKLLQNWYYKVHDSIEARDRSNKREYQYRLHKKLGIESYRNTFNYHRNELKLLRISLDKLQLANKSSRSRCFKLSSSVKEVDHHSLHFGLLHGTKNLSEEMKIFQKLKEVEKDSSAQSTTFREDDKWNITYTEEEKIRSCAVNGNKWRSLGTKQDMLKKIKSLSEQYHNEDEVLLFMKNLKAVENDLRSIDKHWIDVWQLRAEASKCISQLRQQNHKIKVNKETQLLNMTSTFISCMKEKPVSLKNIRRAFKQLQREA